MKKFIALVLVISFIVAIPGDLAAKERRGVELRIVKKSGEVFVAKLVAVKVKQKSLLLVESFSGRDYTWNIHDVNVIFIQKKQRPLLGFCVGGI